MENYLQIFTLNNIILLYTYIFILKGIISLIIFVFFFKSILPLFYLLHCSNIIMYYTLNIFLRISLHKTFNSLIIVIDRSNQRSFQRKTKDR